MASVAVIGTETMVYAEDGDNASANSIKAWHARDALYREGEPFQSVMHPQTGGSL